MTYSTAYRRILYRMKYYEYQQGLIYRHLNQGSGWESHLGRCRDFILRVVNEQRPEKLTVLGSGWLLEFPIAEIAEIVREVVLIDIIHPPEVKSQTEKLGNVKLVERDISGGLIELVWDKTRPYYFLRKLKTLSDINVPGFYFSDDPGMVVSLNILTQIELLPLRMLRKKSRITETEFENFCRSVQQKHIDLLKKYSSVIITDICEKIYGSSGLERENITLLTDLPDGRIKDSWQWDFDLKGVDYSTKKTVFVVKAVFSDIWTTGV